MAVNLSRFGRLRSDGMRVKETIQKDYLTPKETADMLRVSPITIRVWAQKGFLAASTTVGGHRRFERDEVERFARDKGIELVRNTAVRALIVDDDDDHRELVVDVIMEFLPDVVLETAKDGFEAGQKIGTFRPTVVILDLMMPGVDGFKVCRTIKQSEATAHVRVIGMTGFLTDENVRKVKFAGAELCMEKPLNFARLVEIIRTT
ncbi:MAG: excisionase family DNA binding protein [Lentisphaeria bacterium]|jgi:excisionase family DNA binding protein